MWPTTKRSCRANGADLAKNERAYVEALLQRAPRGQGQRRIPPIEDAWREYRSHLWALTALVISAGASADWARRGRARLTIGRAAAAVLRVDARPEALLHLID